MAQRVFGVDARNHRCPYQNCETRAVGEFVEVAFVAVETLFGAIFDEPKKTLFFVEF